MNNDYLPQEFEVCYFEMQMGFNCLHLEGKDIILDFSDSDEKVTPSKVEWERFWDKMEEIGLWDWEADYDKCCMVDGYNWTVTINKGSQNIDATGINDAPTHITGTGVTSSLKILLDALEDLTGFRLDEGSSG